MSRLPLKQRVPGRGWWSIFFWWVILPFITKVYLKLCFRLKLFGTNNIPLEGPALYVGNHQSFLDPIAYGLLTYDRPYHPMVRQTLYDTWFGGWIMRGFQSIPVDRSKGEMAPMKAALTHLQEGERIIIFPEGTRSRDGSLQPFKRGLVLLIKRSKAPVVPMAIEGAYDAWPNHLKRPRLRGLIMAEAGEPIDAEELLKDGPDAAVERLRREIETLRMTLRERIRDATNGRLPEAGPGDSPYWEREARQAEQDNVKNEKVS